jgi:membrane associated rhomboid family serine protease
MFFPFHDENPVERTPIAMYAIVVLNVVVFLWSRQLQPLGQQELAYEHGFVPARIEQLTDRRPIEVPLKVEMAPTPWAQDVGVVRLRLDPKPSEIVLSLVTCMFLHGGWLHLIGNMWFLWIFGNNVEDRLGPVLFLVLYFVGGLLASGAHWLSAPQSTMPVIGASGAIAAALGAYAVTWPWARVRTLVFLFIFITVIDLPAFVVLGAWFLLQLFAAWAPNPMGEPVAFWAHVGGFVTGMVLMPLFSTLVGAGRTDEPHGYQIDNGAHW